MNAFTVMRATLALIQLLICFLPFITCHSQASNHNQLYANFDSVKLEFHPSFTYSSEFLIDGNSSFLKILIYRPKVFFEESEKELITYGTIEVENKTLLASFIDTILALELDSNRVDERVIYDGISGSITKHRKGVIQEKLLLRSPTREEFDLDYRILDSFFQLLECEANDREFLIEYLEDLKGYFDYGLPIKQISEDPLEFRLWGAITGNEIDELYEFLDTLPSSRPIIFDCTNFPGMGNMFHTDFEELNDLHQIYYLVKEGKTPEDLIEIGNCEIYTDRERMNRKIQRENR